jgi:hypothetical protein
MILRAAAAAVLFFAAPALADPSPMATGAVPAPAESVDVALVREELGIVVGMKAAQVRAVLWLENGPAARALEVGFPCDASLDPGVAGLECRTPISVRVDGKKIAVRMRKARPDGHWTWPMRFAAGQKVRVEVEYRAPLRNDRYTQPFDGLGTLHYRLRTGAAWAGPIKELEMRVEIPTDALVAILPAGYRRAKGVVTWSLRDVEPDTDLAIFVHPMYLGRPRAQTAADWAKAPTADKLVEYAGWFHEVALAKLGLPAPAPEDVRRCVAESAALLAEP